MRLRLDPLVELLTAWYIVHGGCRGEDARQRAERDAAIIRAKWKTDDAPTD